LAFVVEGEDVLEKGEAVGGEGEVGTAVEGRGPGGGAVAVLWVVGLVVAVGVVEDGEEADEEEVGAGGGGCEVEGVALDALPVVGAVEGMRAEAELSTGEGPEGGEVKGRRVRGGHDGVSLGWFRERVKECGYSWTRGHCVARHHQRVWVLAAE
jgi:hypothetical protein